MIDPLEKSILILVSLFLLAGCGPEGSKNPENPEDSFKAPVDYEIASTKDLSSPVPGDLSQYSSQDEIPQNRKIQYFVVVGDPIERNEVKPTVEAVIQHIIMMDEEVDEVILELCSNEGAASSGSHDIARAVWAPEGELGNVTPEIAENNLRESYEISTEIREDLQEYLETKQKSEKKHGLSKEKRKEIYYELVKAEDRAIKEADEKFSVGTDEHSKATDKLLDQYSKEVREEYGISEEVSSSIAVEGAEKSWETPEF